MPYSSGCGQQCVHSERRRAMIATYHQVVRLSRHCVCGGSHLSLWKTQPNPNNNNQDYCSIKLMESVALPIGHCTQRSHDMLTMLHAGKCEVNNLILYTICPRGCLGVHRCPYSTYKNLMALMCVLYILLDAHFTPRLDQTLLYTLSVPAGHK